MLKELKDRHDRAGKKVELIIVDDLCHTMNLYQQTFPVVKLRLDFFHALCFININWRSTVNDYVCETDFEICDRAC